MYTPPMTSAAIHQTMSRRTKRERLVSGLRGTRLSAQSRTG